MFKISYFHSERFILSYFNFLIKIKFFSSQKRLFFLFLFSLFSYYSVTFAFKSLNKYCDNYSYDFCRYL
ncbi:uncharacterized protein DS421_17g590560 [Arachis hypogaea]|nr:uncharacterized protein DS421_17g590560 [Arachis hypogaea]